MTLHQDITALRAAVYIRYSSENQRDGYSVEYQLDECKKYIAEQGFAFEKAYIDEAVSGKSANKRNAFFELLADVKNGLYDVVIVYKYSRFARNLMEATLYRQQIEKNGAKLISAMERIDDSTPEGRMMRNIIMTMDEYYSDNLSTFVQSSMYTAAKSGKYLGGILPYGFSVNENGEFIENKAEADVVRRVFELRAAGAMPADILRLFREEGVRGRNGKPFTQQLLNKIVRSEKYIGTYKYSVKGYEPIYIENAFAPIVSRELWDKVQHIVDNLNVKKAAKGRARKNIYPLTGKIFCACCGEPFTGNSKGNGIAYYTCRGQDKLQICKNGSVLKSMLEEYVFGKIKELILSENHIDEITQIVFDTFNNGTTETDIAAEIAALKKEKADIERKLENLLDLLLDGTISKDILHKKSAALQAELKTVESALKSKEFTAAAAVTYEGIRGFLLDMVKQLETADETVKKALASQFIDKIIVDEDDIKVRLTVSPFFTGDKLNDGWALFTLSPKRKKSRSGRLTRLYI